MAKVPPRNPNYSAADLWPPGSQGVEFPPAAFHPVYLGNFLCQQYSELVPRVQQYFASKGLLVRMVFSRGADTDPFRAYQDKTKLYDCLVYFTRPEDAQDAIKYLHRDKYFGHRLNIFPGRKGTFFSAIKTVQVDHLPGVCDDAPAQIFEDEIRRIQAMKRVQTVAAQRQLDINLYRAMFPNAYKQFMAVLQASYGDPRATEFLQMYVPPFLRRPEPLTPWEWRHWELHNEGLEYVRGVVRQREYNLSRRLANEFLQ